MKEAKIPHEWPPFPASSMPTQCGIGPSLLSPSSSSAAASLPSGINKEKRHCADLKSFSRNGMDEHRQISGKNIYSGFKHPAGFKEHCVKIFMQGNLAKLWYTESFSVDIYKEASNSRLSLVWHHPRNFHRAVNSRPWRFRSFCEQSTGQDSCFPQVLIVQ